ncbi:type III pantothenate kinase [Lysobacter sp. GX 14042]|uniref:type III pantothenate kinase n=1 Tax=Lysobacter sp. GX 14042 TaxID=2907155 RepID=UPI001F47F4DB|nr:type III pantothenate kinase [Lysobacter sp. GX 14042]MCE7032010.1 type III pantothenate kinase [Lysobacter sp. GX 14042]
MSEWLFDLGNTRLKAAPLRPDGGVGEVIALDHHDDGFEAALGDVLPARLEAAFVAAVTGPETRLRLARALGGRCGRISFAASAARLGRLVVGYPRPERMGVDRFLALLAASSDGGGPALVCGVGTALTVDLLDAGGRHLGGRIAPSPELMRQVLHQRAAHLPTQGGQYGVFATDTADALASGCQGAAVALVEQSMAEAVRRLEGTPRLLLHGGGAAALQPRLSGARPRPLLVLEGLAQWARMQSAQ